MNHDAQKTGSAMTWRSKLKIRAWVFVIGVPLAVLGVISVSPAWMTLPLVGVAVAAITVTVNKIGHRLTQPTCWTCGHDLRNEEPAEQGIVCPSCGALNQFYLAHAAHPSDESDLGSTDDEA
jgi:hypothetical protein